MHTPLTQREEALMETARAAAAAIDGLKEGEIREFSVRDYKKIPELPFSSIDNKTRVELLKKGTPPQGQTRTKSLALRQDIWMLTRE